MICKIAGLGVDVPELGDLPQRCKPYEANIPVDICLDREKVLPIRWDTLSPADNYYLSSGSLFYRHLIDFDGFMLHASAVVVDGYAYLFTGPCGMGKSTHTTLYLQQFGERAEVINDDKPALRHIDGQWYAYGTPWCGKDGINANRKAKLGGICVLHRGDTQMRRIAASEALPFLLGQTQYRLKAAPMATLMGLMDHLVREVPVFSLHSHAQPEDAVLTYTEMTKAIKEKEYATES